MGRRTLTILVTLLPIAVGTATAGELQRSEIAPSADWVAHVNVEAFRNSDLGKLIMSQLVSQEIEQKLQSFATIFSFNPLTDIRDVTLYGKGQDRSNAVAVIEGRFDKNQLLALVRLNAQYQEIPHKGTTLYRWVHEDPKAPEKAGQLMYGCFCGDNQVMISSGFDALKQGVDTIQGGPGASAGLLKQIPEVQGTTFVQVVAADVGRMAGQDPKAAMLRQTKSLGLAGGQSGEKVFVELHLRGESAEVADSMTKMIQGLIALAQLSSQEQPQLSELARNVTVSQTDITTQVRLAIPAQTVVNFVKQQWEQKKQQPVPAQTP